MGFMDQIGGLLDQYARGATPSPEDARAHYDQIAQAVPTNVLGSVIGPALASLGQPQVREGVQNSATEMNADQRGQLVKTLLGGLGGENPGSVLSRLGVNPAVAQNPQQATPSEVATLATHVQQAQPEVFNQAMRFYAQHPLLVKVLGTMAIAKIAQHLSRQPLQTR